jgi:hypothetical protein
MEAIRRNTLMNMFFFFFIYLKYFFYFTEFLNYGNNFIILSFSGIIVKLNKFYKKITIFPQNKEISI